jgi:hypothetical protein
MKKLFAAILITASLLACSNNKEHSEHTGSAAVEEKHEDHATTGGLVLNNGAKWKADSPTVRNVALLQETVDKANSGSLENYQQAAGQLQDGLNKMIKECKMKGADHDALHQWLEPLLAKSKVLQTATTVENASAIFSDIRKQVSLFPTYFE